MSEDDFEDIDSGQQEQETSFHIEADLYDSGDYTNMLVVGCNDSYIVISNNEHLCTLVHSCKEVECWEQVDGMLDEEVVERIGAAIESYTGSQSGSNY